MTAKPSETDACASVTAVFLKVLAGLHDAETVRFGHIHNIFKVRPGCWEAPIFRHCHKRSLMRPQHKARRRWHVTITGRTQALHGALGQAAHCLLDSTYSTGSRGSTGSAGSNTFRTGQPWTTLLCAVALSMVDTIAHS
ncbi:unnamed protein product [Ostreobium quekettii]|uniref:Uncharacterized protein n=1 Tax=Ostreobium quekettii TaxID=121088 RepID=A0A8S1J0A2_9CHLO|nr:unnamed protein product [Ostreobium quekettii]